MKRWMVLLGVVLLLTMVVVPTVSGKVIREPYAGIEMPPEILDFGDWTYPGDNVHFRGMVEIMRVETDCARVTGWNTVVANGNQDANGYGPVWGTTHVDVDAVDGYWEGTFTGVVDETGMHLRMRARGYGDLSGMLIDGTMENFVIEGVILELPVP